MVNDDRHDGLDRLIRDAMSGSGTRPAEACPDADVIAAYVDGGLSADERLAIEPHLASCARCCGVLAVIGKDASAPAGEAARPEPVPGRRRWLPRLAWLVPATAVAAGVLLYVAVGPVPTGDDRQGPPPAAADAPAAIARAEGPPATAAATPAEPSAAAGAAPSAPAANKASPPRAAQAEDVVAAAAPPPAAPAPAPAPGAVATFAEQAPAMPVGMIAPAPAAAGRQAKREAVASAETSLQSTRAASAPLAGATVMPMTMDARYAAADVVVLATAGAPTDGTVLLTVIEVFKRRDDLAPELSLAVDASARLTPGRRHLAFLKAPADAGPGAVFQPVDAASIVPAGDDAAPLLARLRQLAGTTRR